MIKSEHISKQNNRDMKLNVGSETTRDNNLMNILTSPQFLLNLSKINDLSRLNEQQAHNSINTSQSQSPPTSFETYLLYISIFIIIVLLIIDIVLRISAKTD